MLIQAPDGQECLGAVPAGGGGSIVALDFMCKQLLVIMEGGGTKVALHSRFLRNRSFGLGTVAGVGVPFVDS
jgi:hypothetical protein